MISKVVLATVRYKAGVLLLLVVVVVVAFIICGSFVNRSGRPVARSAQQKNKFLT